MKIFVMGMVRTRSSYLLDILCKYYNIKNEFEYYAGGRTENDAKTFFKEHKIMFENYKKIVLKYTERLHTNNNFATKFFPTLGVNYLKLKSRHSVTYPPSPSYTFEVADFLDLQSYFRINEYDKIYFLYRKNLASGMASFLHGKSIQTRVNPEMNYKKGLIFEQNEKYLINLYNPKNKLYYTKEDVNMYVYEYLLLEMYERYLIGKNISFTKLEYDEIPKYVQENFPDVSSDYVETNYDYTNFSNYKELEQDINDSLYTLKKDNSFLFS